MSESGRPTRDEQLPPLRLTQRGRVALAVLGLLALLVFVQLVKGCTGDPATTAVPKPEDAATTATTTPSATPSGQSSAPSAGASTTPSSTPSPTRTSILDGIVHSGDKGSGKWNTSMTQVATTHQLKNPHRYVVKVETNLNLTPDGVARQIQSILDDQRSWPGSTQNSFSLVSDESKADLTIYLASPDTTQSMCRPLDVVKTWSCHSGSRVILNADRWRFMTPTYTDLGEYRAYMVNHEVGHFIGRGHIGCPKSGDVAPVMMQQSKSLGGCTTNAWPANSGGR